jgi:hypothetical protein
MIRMNGKAIHLNAGGESSLPLSFSRRSEPGFSDGKRPLPDSISFSDRDSVRNIKGHRQRKKGTREIRRLAFQRSVVECQLLMRNPSRHPALEPLSE